MAYYPTTLAMLKDVEAELKRELEKHPEVHAPHTEKDRDEWLARTFPGVRRKATRQWKVKQARPRGKRLPRHFDPVDAAFGLGSIQKFKLAPTVRKALGYNAPIPLERLADELAKIGQGVDSKLARGFWYPEHDYVGHALGPETEGLHIWTIRTAFLPNPPMKWLWGNSTFQDHVDSVSETLNCHPALALAFLLCDMPVYRDAVTVVLPPYVSLSPNQGISLYVGRAQVPVWLVNSMYRLAREIVLVMENRGKAIAKSPRPRAETRRVASLISLVDETKSLKWVGHLSKWNDDHPEWKYENVNSMRAVYYRAKAVRTRGKGGVRSSRKPTREGGMSHEK